MPELNVMRLEKILKDFYTATHFRVALLDRHMQEKLSFPKERSPFCELIRQKPELNEKCRLCDQEAFQKCAKQQQPLIYACHAGLMEAIVPVKDEDHILCYLMFGQIITEDDVTEQRQQILDRFIGQGLDDEALREAVDKIRVRTKEHIEACSTIAASLVLFILKHQMVKPDKDQFIDMLDSYIDNNMNQNIQINDLCSYFYVSRTKLYSLAVPYLGCSLSEYVQRRKIRYAKELLQTTDMTVEQIAEAVGFSDSSYFRRVFHQKAGISARECRKAAKKL